MANIRVDKVTGEVRDVDDFLDAWIDEQVAEGRLLDAPYVRADVYDSLGRELTYYDGLVRQRESGQHAALFAADWLAKRAHLSPMQVTDAHFDAFGDGDPNKKLDARAKLFRKLELELGDRRAAEGALKTIADRWGASLSNLKPGKAPPEAVDNPAPPKPLNDPQFARLNNPWSTMRRPDGSLDPKSVARTADITARLGTKAAAEMAKAAGKTLDGRNLPSGK